MRRSPLGNASVAVACVAGACVAVACADVSLPSTTEGGGAADVAVGGTTTTAAGAGGEAPLDCSHLDDACGVGSIVSGVCQRAPRPDGVGCDDGLACTALDHCIGGQCVAGSPAECVSLDPCRAAACNERTGLCELAAANDGASCDDGDVCTKLTTCTAGACGGGSPVNCFDVGPCHTSLCHPSTGCYVVAANVGEPCGGTPIGVACGEGRCMDTPYPHCGWVPINEGVPCDDGNSCTEGEVCASGSCTGQPTADGAPCDDALSCTLGEVCLSGGCQPGVDVCPPTTDACVVVTCSYKDACLGALDGGSPCEHPSPCRGAGTCDVGLCTQAGPENDGAPCDDANACTTLDQCGGGSCAGAPVTACASGDGCCPAGCAAATDADCAVLVYMASTAALPGVHVYDVAAGIWSQVPDPPSPPVSRLAAWDTKVLVVGADANVYELDPGTLTWSFVRGAPPLPSGGGQNHFVTALPGGLLVAPSSDGALYVATGETWVEHFVGERSSAAHRDPTTGRVLFRHVTDATVFTFDPATNLYAYWAFSTDPTLVGAADARFGAHHDGTFYTVTEPSTHEVLAISEGIGDAYLLGVVTADASPSGDVDPATGLIYLGPSGSGGAFQRLDPPSATLVDLTPPPPLPDGYLSSVVVVRAPSAP